MKTLTFYAMVECNECIDGYMVDQWHDQVPCDYCHGTKLIEVEETETVNE